MVTITPSGGGNRKNINGYISMCVLQAYYLQRLPLSCNRQVYVATQFFSCLFLQWMVRETRSVPVNWSCFHFFL